MKILYIFPFLLAVIITGLFRTSQTDKVVLDFLDFRNASFEETLPLAKSGSHIAQFNLGLMYKTGEGVNKNNQKAAKWFQRAADQGHKDVTKFKNLLAKQMSLSQIQKAQRLATEFKPKK